MWTAHTDPFVNLRAYKPNPDTYLGACKLLSLEPHQVAMVAAHIEDLRAAASYGVSGPLTSAGQCPANPFWSF